MESISPILLALVGREREIYIFPWLQVRITGPRHHLTSSLGSYRRSMTVFTVCLRVWSLGYAAWFGVLFGRFYCRSRGSCVRFSLGEVGEVVSIGFHWRSGSLVARFCIRSPLRDLRGSCFLECLSLCQRALQVAWWSGAPSSIISPYSSCV